jgi:hypothetical protein
MLPFIDDLLIRHYKSAALTRYFGIAPGGTLTNSSKIATAVVHHTDPLTAPNTSPAPPAPPSSEPFHHRAQLLIARNQRTTLRFRHCNDSFPLRVVETHGTDAEPKAHAPGRSAPALAHASINHPYGPYWVQQVIHAQVFVRFLTLPFLHIPPEPFRRIPNPTRSTRRRIAKTHNRYPFLELIVGRTLGSITASNRSSPGANGMPRCFGITDSSSLLSWSRRQIERLSSTTKGSERRPWSGSHRGSTDGRDGSCTGWTLHSRPTSSPPKNRCMEHKKEHEARAQEDITSYARMSS